ncbi:MAG: hypothetical protein MJA84_18235 [Firmicutes bacterium]|nr:hypothetical protein [Bacillota bacterium]
MAFPSAAMLALRGAVSVPLAQPAYYAPDINRLVMPVDNNRGYILLGVLLAITVLCILVAPLSLSLVQSARQSESAIKRLTALELAQGKLEEVTSYKYEDIGPSGRENFHAPFGSFDFVVRVTEDSAAKGIKMITVTVYYPDLTADVEKTVSVTGALAKRYRF